MMDGLKIFRTILGGLIKNGPPKLTIFKLDYNRPFLSTFYKVGLKEFIRNKFMKFVREDINQKVEIVDFSKMEKVELEQIS